MLQRVMGGLRHWADNARSGIEGATVLSSLILNVRNRREHAYLQEGSAKPPGNSLAKPGMFV